MCEYMVNDTHTQQNMHGNEKHQKLPQGKEGGEQNWGGIRKGFKILSNVSSQRRERGREANMAPNTRFVGQQELYTFCMLEPFHN